MTVETEPVQIVLRGGHGYVSGLPFEVIEKIEAATSFRPAGYQYTMQFQRASAKRRKDVGWVRLFRHSKFPVGLAQRIIGILRANDVPVVIDAETAMDDKPQLRTKTIGLEDRWYQQEAVEAALLNPRGIIQASTGAGKTIIQAMLIEARQRHTLLVVPTIDLLHQTRDFLTEHLVRDAWKEDGGGLDFDVLRSEWRIGQLGDGVVDPQPVTVATVRTAAKALSVAYERYEYGEYDDKDDTEVHPAELRDWVQSIGLLMIDEAHILGAQTVFDLAVAVPAPNKYGFSASPWRDDGADLMIEAATGPRIYRIGAKVLVDEGYLVPPIIRVVDTKGWWTPAAWGQVCRRCSEGRPMTPKGPAKICPSCGGQQWRSEFTEAYSHEIVNNPIRNQNIADIVTGKLSVGVPVPSPHLILVKQVNHGRLLEGLIPGSRFLSGTDAGGERKRAFNEVRAGLLNTVICTVIADLGLDVPSLRSLVLAGGGKSSTRHLQRIGRVARPYEGKDHATILDFDDGHVHPWFRRHEGERRRVERAEWGGVALWL